MNNYNRLDYMCKGKEFRWTRQQKKAIPEEIALYFDVSQKSIRVSDLQLYPT